MIKKDILTIIFIIFSSYLLAQTNFDDRIQRTYNCSDISQTSSKLFEKFYLEGQLDSAQQVVDYWFDKCGLKEPVFRAKILLSLTNETFKDSILTDNFLYFVYNYQNRMDMIEHSDYSNYDYYMPYFGFIPPGQAFDDFTIEAARFLTNKYDKTSFEYLLCEFYSFNYDTLFTKIQDEKYREIGFYNEYEKEVKKYVNKTDFHLAWITGVWIPTNELSPLGIHPELGFILGAKTWKINYDMIIAFKINESKSMYSVLDRNDSIVQTKHFFGGYIGCDFGFDLYNKDRNEIQILGGIAYDGFDAIESDLDNDKKGVSVGSLNLNTGLSYRYFLNNSLYLGLRAKYSFVDYSNSGKVDMKGNTFSVQFVIGGLGNAMKYNNLSKLKYEGVRK